MPLGQPNPEPYLRSLLVCHDPAGDPNEYPYNVPAVRLTSDLKLHDKVTYFVGENGSGKSTLLEAIAMLEGFNAEGGTRNFRFETTPANERLKYLVRVARGPRGKLRRDSFFFRAESFFNVVSEIERLGVGGAYGPRSLHEVSHGEALLALMTHRLRGGGLYLFDEPESALSPQRQLMFLRAVHDLVENDSQLIICTHSPIILSYPDALIYEFSAEGVQPIAYEDTEHVRVTRTFLERRERMLHELFSD